VLFATIILIMFILCGTGVILVAHHTMVEPREPRSQAKRQPVNSFLDLLSEQERKQCLGRTQVC